MRLQVEAKMVEGWGSRTVAVVAFEVPEFQGRDFSYLALVG